LTTDDVRNNERQFHSVGTVDADTHATSVATPRAVYTRPNSKIAIAIMDPSGFLSDAELSDVLAQLDRHGNAQLRKLKRIEFGPPPMATPEEEGLGQKVVVDEKGIVKIYSKDSLDELVAMGIAAEMVDYGLNRKEKAYWLAQGSRADYIFAYSERFTTPVIPFAAAPTNPSAN
jgi:hypothetical protein